MLRILGCFWDAGQKLSAKYNPIPECQSTRQEKVVHVWGHMGKEKGVLSPNLLLQDDGVLKAGRKDRGG